MYIFTGNEPKVFSHDRCTISPPQLAAAVHPSSLELPPARHSFRSPGHPSRSVRPPPAGTTGPDLLRPAGSRTGPGGGQASPPLGPAAAQPGSTRCFSPTARSWVLPAREVFQACQHLGDRQTRQRPTDVPLPGELFGEPCRWEAGRCRVMVEHHTSDIGRTVSLSAVVAWQDRSALPGRGVL